MSNRPTISEYAGFYIRLLDGSDGYLLQMRWTIAAFQKWAGRTLYIDELNEQLINDYLHFTKDNLAPETRRSRRNILVRLWRHAATNPTLSVRPASPNRDLIGKVKRRSSAPLLWDLPNCQQLLAVADELTGEYRNGVCKRLYWRAWILAVWSSGLRRCDLMALKRADVPASGRVTIVQQKTGKHVTGEFKPEALAAIDQLCMQHKGELVFPLWCSLRCWRKIAQRIVRRAGIGGSIGKLRGSAGTAVENLFPGRGPQFLGNSPQVFYKFYYDRRLSNDFPHPPNLTQ